MLGITYNWNLVVEIPFDSTRKRMSVIVKNEDNKVFVMTKGADNIILPLCTFPRNDQNKITDTLFKFSCCGLRTLVMAQKEIEPEIFEVWFKEFEKVNFSIDEDKEEQLTLLYEEIEV